MVKKGILAGSSVLALVLGGSALAQGDDSDEDRDVIVVTGVRGSLVQGLENKRAAIQNIESIVAEDIGKLPDNNVIEALQRVTGVQITDRGGGEASAVFIRGLPDVTTTWNGRFVFTASGRQLALQDIPSNLVKQIDVYKTRAAEQIETGIAGQIDVMTRRPFDFDGFAFNVAARGIYQEQRETFDPNVSALISDHWETEAGDFGILVNASYLKTRFRDQSVTAGAMVPFATADDPPPGWVPLERIFPTDGRAPGQELWQTGLDRGLPTAPGSTLTINGMEEEYYLSRDALFASDFRGDRTRPAVNAAIQWAPNESSTYTAEFFYQGYREELFNNLHFTFADWWGSLGPDPTSTITLYEGTNIIKTRVVGAPFGFNSGDFTDQSTDSFVYALNGQWEIGDRLNLVADVAYQDSEFSTDFSAVRTTRVPASITIDFNTGNGIPSWEFNDNSELVDPAVWTVAEFFDNRGRTEGNAWTFMADGDLDLDLDDDGFFKRLSFGARYDDRSAAESQLPPMPTPFLGQPLSSLDQGFQWINEGFFDGRANVPSSWVVANGYYIRDNIDDVRALYGVTKPELVEAFSVDEATLAFYGQLDMEYLLFGRPLFVQAGLRYVRVETDMVFTDLNTDPFVTTGASRVVSDYLPSVTVIYDLTDDFRLRFNYGETLRRPNFVDLNPNFSLTGDLTMIGRGSGTGGNPDLGPAMARNFDLAAEWYFENDSAIYVTLFRREIDGLVVPLTRRIVIPGTGLNTDVFAVTQPVNASDGVLKGVEAGLVYFPNNLPGILDGLGVQGSLTALDSSQNIPLTNSAGDIIGEENTSFFGVSDTSYNATLAYDRGRLSARLSYVWRDNFLNNNEARLFANPIGIHRLPEESLDLQVNVQVLENATVTFDATNLTNELQQSYYAFGDAGGPDTHNFGSTILSRTFAIGLRFSL